MGENVARNLDEGRLVPAIGVFERVVAALPGNGDYVGIVAGRIFTSVTICPPVGLAEKENGP